ncbi:hypothetical protein A4H97_15985 [Niastella yeongjuensis]|uniref:Uncharacterized protein n=1 Tax=Niastella yeongjuensis TaxID=354355 RepID=A0A1V9E5A3_9BACT|nr:hypothetical protein A4H97_15985 [Niastella yeongjuensis]
MKETTDSRTYNLVRKELYAACSRCPWHPTFWRTCIDNPYTPMYMENDTRQIRNHPNWKLVSRNRKQWMKKRFIEVKQRSRSRFVTYYTW